MRRNGDPKHPLHVWEKVSQKGHLVRWKCAAGTLCNATKMTFDGKSREA